MHFKYAELMSPRLLAMKCLSEIFIFLLYIIDVRRYFGFGVNCIGALIADTLKSWRMENATQSMKCGPIVYDANYSNFI